MRFQDTPELAQWRGTVRTFVDENWRIPGRAEDVDLGIEGPADEGRAKRWLDKLGANGWLAPAWPKKYGGADM